MNLFELIKSKFKSKTIETNIIPFDTTKIEIPKYKELTSKEQSIVKEYEQELKIEDFSTLINYPYDIRNKGDKIAKLLNELLYNLNKYLENLDIKKSLGRDIEIDPLQFVNYLIDTKKIKVLNQELNNLILDTTLRIIAVREYIKKYKLINILKSKTNINYLKNLENTMIVTLMTLNAIKKVNDNIDIDSDNIQDSLTKIAKLNQNIDLLKNGCNIKLEYFKDINKYLLDNKLDLESVRDLINNLTKEKEPELLIKLALLDIEVNNYLNDSKDKLVNYFNEQLKKIEKVRITYDNKDNYISILDKLVVIKDILKIEFSNIDIKRLYKIKLRIDLLDIYSNRNPFRYLKNDEEIIIYDEIIKEEINKFLSLKASNKKDEARNKYLKRKIQTSLEKIAKENKDNLGLQLMLSTRFIEIIYMVNHSGYYQELFNVKIRDAFNLRNGHRYSFQEDTFYVLYNDDVFVNLEDKPLIIDYTMLRDLEKLYLTDYIFKIDIEKVQVHIIALILILLNYQYNIDFLVSVNHDTLTFSEGIREIRATDAILYESDFLGPYHNQKRYMLIVNIKHINLPSTLKVIGENTFYRFDLEDVLIPDSVEEIEKQAFNDEIMKKIENSKVKVKR